MLTIFSTPKAFKGHNRVIQLNAITSWTRLEPDCEIILLGSDSGTAETAAKLGLRHIPNIDCNENGTPYLWSIFQKAQEAAVYDRLCYVNADIILMQDFIDALQRIPEDNTLTIGRRWDLDLRELIDFSSDEWDTIVRSILAERGKLHAETGMDFFVFPRGFFRNMPDFYLGRTAWDNWLVFQARYQKADVVDITTEATIIHQNHDYNHVIGQAQGAFKGPEAIRNRQLAGGWEYSFGIRHATKRLTPEGLVKKRSCRDLWVQLDALPVLYDGLRFLGFFRRLRHSLQVAVGTVYHKIFG